VLKAVDLKTHHRDNAVAITSSSEIAGIPAIAIKPQQLEYNLSVIQFVKFH
jgi:hypothetical protein